MAALEALNEAVVDCRRCPRLVEWREQVAREKRAAYRDWTYWGRPMPGFGDPAARILVLGLAPAAHGGNRTGRIFTGDRSGDFLFAGLHRVGLANQAESIHKDDGLKLNGAYMVAAVRCAPPANLPTPEERANCSDWLEREVALLPDIHVVLCLGGFAWESALRLRASLGGTVTRPKPKFGHGVGRRRGAVAAARLLPPQPAEHVHRQAHARHARRGAESGPRVGLGRVRRYLEILRSPWVGALVASSLLSRLPIGINALAIVLYLREQTGSFAVAGAVSGTLASRLGHRRAGAGPARGPARRAPGAAAESRSSTRVSLGAIVGLAELSRRRSPCSCAASSAASRSRRPRPCCARCGPTCSSRACTRPPTRWTAP